MIKFMLWQDAFLLVVDIFLVGILGWYITRKAKLGLWRSASSDAGIALTVYFIGALLNGIANVTWTRGWVSDHTHIWVIAAATLVLLIGASCILRLFAEYAWQWLAWAWVWCVVVAALIATAVLLVDSPVVIPTQ